MLTLPGEGWADLLQLIYSGLCSCASSGVWESSSSAASLVVMVVVACCWPLLIAVLWWLDCCPHAELRHRSRAAAQYFHCWARGRLCLRFAHCRIGPWQRGSAGSRCPAGTREGDASVMTR